MNAQKLIPKKPVMGLGLAALGRPGYINLGHNRDIGPDKSREAMSRRAYEVLDKAYLLGLRYFDAARSYGQAEAFLATWLQKKRPDDVFIASKWGYTYTADWQVEAHVHEHKEHSVAVLERQWAESKNLLGDYLQLYQIHSATFQSGVLDNTEVLRRLWRLREQGIHIGITVSGAEQAAIIGKAMAIGRDGQQLFSSVQATWNLLAQSVAPMLEKAAAEGILVVIKEALANGRLAHSQGLDQGALLDKSAHELQLSIDQLSLAAVFAQPWAHVVLSGATTVEQLQSNVTAASVQIPESIFKRLLGLRQHESAYWQSRQQLAWN